jgi:ABC-type multidrug transport system permease subunit
MRGLWRQIVLSIRLNFRNRMALIYGYLFPAVFLLAFRTLYRQERVPLALHLGELLTVTILGGACFGLPTGIVSDRERGVWRRYRMLPVSPLGVLGATLVTRYLLLLTAGLLQVGLAVASGMPVPRHPLALWAAFSVAAIAFMGIGLDIAMLAANVPAVQALGQCIFLPMLIVGGVAVPLSSLPSWAQHVSAFLPGRYAVEAIQASVTSAGATPTKFDVLELLAIGAAGAAAGILAFRWDTRQRTSPWVAVAVIGWLIAGAAAESHGSIHVESVQREEQHKASEYLPPVPQAPPADQPAKPVVEEVGTRPAERPAPVEFKGPATWQAVTTGDIDGVAFERLPADTGVVAPIAAADEEPDPSVADQIERVRSALPDWTPGRIGDPVQRVRNYLSAAAVADVYRMDPLERFLPLAVFDQIQASVPAEDLPKILYFIAVHPLDGSDSAARQLHQLGLPDGPSDTRTMRDRIMLYAFKLLGRLTGSPGGK